jgi:hypothetical protein
MTDPVMAPGDDVPNVDVDCHCAETSTDSISDERLKAVTDRLDTLNANLFWLCQTFHALLASIPRNGMLGLMARKVLNQQDQGQAPHGN